MVILIIIGTFTMTELMYLHPEYKWGLGKAYALIASIFK